MKKYLRILMAIVVCLVGILGVIGGGVVAAEEDNVDVAVVNQDWSDLSILKNIWDAMRQSQDPEAYYKSLPDEARTALINTIRQIKFVTDTSETYADYGPSGIQVEVHAYDAWNEHVFDYAQRIDWQWDGTYITSIDYYGAFGAPASGYEQFVHYEGIIYENHVTGPTQFEGWTTGSFYMEVYGTPVWTATASAYAYVTGWGTANGTGSYYIYY